MTNTRRRTRAAAAISLAMLLGASPAIASEVGDESAQVEVAQDAPAVEADVPAEVSDEVGEAPAEVSDAPAELVAVEPVVEPVAADLPAPAVPAAVAPVPAAAPAAPAADEPVADTTRPTTVLNTPTTAGPFNTARIGVSISAADETGLNRVVGNVYRDGKLVAPAQMNANGALTATFEPSYSLPDGAYTLRYNSSDLAGNVSTTREHAFTVDNTNPTITIKTEPSYTAGLDGRYTTISFKLFDAGKVDKVEINGVLKELGNNVWSDVNFVKPGVFGAVEGLNTIVAYDVAGNFSTLTFVLDTTGPTITIKPAPDSKGAGGIYREISFKLFDAAKVDKVEINGVLKDLSNNAWSDVNFVKPGVFGAVEGVNTIVAYDALGNASTLTFILDTTGPTITVKPEMTVPAEGGYESVSFKLFDAYKVDKVEINGVLKDLTDSVWSDVNGIRPGVFGAVLGLNTIVAYDVAGNATTLTFTLVAPVVVDPVDPELPVVVPAGPIAPPVVAPPADGRGPLPVAQGEPDVAAPAVVVSVKATEEAAPTGSATASTEAATTAAASTAAATTAKLPSTGSPLFPVAGMAAVLLAVGVVLMRRRGLAD